MVEFLRNEEGQGLVEYALIIAVIAIAVIVAMVFFRDQLSNYFRTSAITSRRSGAAASPLRGLEALPTI